MHDLNRLLFILFTGATLFQLAAWWGVYARSAWSKKHRTAARATFSPPVSVLICARNEATNLERYLPLVLQQDYPEFEVLVIDDDSTDRTPELLRGLQARYPRLRTLHAGPKVSPGKKRALAQGIAAAQHEYLVFTDADCRPASAHWLRHMAAGFEKASIVLGYGPCTPAPGLLNRWVRFETVQTAMQYFGAALAGRPYMGVGRNLAWKRELFGRAGGFARHERLASGDDDLLVNAVADRHNTAVCRAPESFMYSEGPGSWAGWLRQKRRHLSAGPLYRPEHRFLLSALAVSQILHYFLLTPLLFSDFGTVCVILYASRMASAFTLYWRVLRQFCDERLIIWFPLFDALLAIYYAVFVPYALIRSNHLISWK